MRIHNDWGKVLRIENHEAKGYVYYIIGARYKGYVYTSNELISDNQNKLISEGDCIRVKYDLDCTSDVCKAYSMQSSRSEICKIMDYDQSDVDFLFNGFNVDSLLI